MKLKKTSLKNYWLYAVLAAASLVPQESVSQTGGAPPLHFDPQSRLPLPDISDRDRLRFLTTTDFPPFNYIDQSGRLAGFNVDLARNICAELNVETICEVQALPFAELDDAIASGAGEAVIAGLAVTGESRQTYRFTQSYLKLPARFVERRDAGPQAARVQDRLSGGDAVGVVSDTAHEAMLRSYFPDLSARSFPDAQAMFAALREEEIDAVFADGVRLSFWLSSDDAEECCRFLDGPFLSQRYLGEGLAIALAPGDKILAEAIDYALLALSRNGRLSEIYLRYFPNGIY